MKTTYKIVIDMETFAPATVWHDYFGPVDSFKASQAETGLSADQASFYKTLTNTFTQQFGKQSSILQGLTSSFQPLMDINSRIANTFEPILAAGPGQKGYTPEQEAAIRTSASDTNAQQFTNAKIAVQNENQSGGSELLPSGAQAQLASNVNTTAAAQEAQSQNTITQQNYNLGRQNFNNAAQVLGGVSSETTNALVAGPNSVSRQLNPLDYAGAVNSSGHDAFGSANAINQENTAWQGAVGGILGGAVGAFSGGLGAAAGKSLFGT